MGKRYRLPVEAMVEVMKRSADRLLLHTQIPALPGVCKQECLIQLVLGQGTVFSCTILNPRTGTVLLQDQKAYQALQRCGDLEWQVIPPAAFAPGWDVASQPAGSSTVAQTTTACIPTLRVRSLSPETLASCSYPYRTVLLLVDGKRSIHEIAQLLSKSPNAIQQMLAGLPHLVQL